MPSHHHSSIGLELRSHRRLIDQPTKRRESDDFGKRVSFLVDLGDLYKYKSLGKLRPCAQRWAHDLGHQWAMRVLILADDCNPEWPSLPAVGYKAVRAIAEYVDVVVATHVRNRENIERWGFGRAQVRYFDNEYIARPMYRLAKFLRGGTATGWTTAIALSYPSYLAFEWEVWKALQDQLHQRQFDIVHRITPMSPTLPSPIAKWSPVPFVLGPLNGGLRWPFEFKREQAREREWLSSLREAYRMLPFYRATYRHSKAVLAGFAHTIMDLPIYASENALNFPEIGIDPHLFNSPASGGKQKTILFVGRFVPYKLPQVVVRAFAKSRAAHSHRLIMVGDGPERQAVEDLVRHLNVEKQVSLVGWKTQKEVASLMSEAEIFVFPSIRELGAGAVLEAMACGLACVVVDYGGPATLIGADRGIKVPLGEIDEIARGFERALDLLVGDEKLTIKLGMAAQEHAMRFYTWDAKARKTIQVYESVLGSTQRPDFWACEMEKSSEHL